MSSLPEQLEVPGRHIKLEVPRKFETNFTIAGKVLRVGFSRKAQLLSQVCLDVLPELLYDVTSKEVLDQSLIVLFENSLENFNFVFTKRLVKRSTFFFVWVDKKSHGPNCEGGWVVQVC